MLLLLLIYVVLRALWKIDVHLINTLVNIFFIIFILLYWGELLNINYEAFFDFNFPGEKRAT